MVKKKLIFDLGFHNGDDTDFYLKMGYDVVALEANPKLINNGIKRFNKYINKNNLILINKAVSDRTGVQNFYIHSTKSNWSSSDKILAESDGSKSKVILVEGISFNDLCCDFGVPIYVKVDIEGNDLLVAKQLYDLKTKPKYVSFEISKNNYAGIFSWLYISGYRKFQLVNQLNNPDRKLEKVINGKKIKYQFTKDSSGYFGKDLPDNKWFPFNEALANYIKYRELKFIDNKELALGWLDLHASL